MDPATRFLVLLTLDEMLRIDSFECVICIDMICKILHALVNVFFTILTRVVMHTVTRKSPQ